MTPKAMIGVISVLKNQETFEIQRAREEGREPRVYHGVFASHPSADDRLQQAVSVARPAAGGAARVGVEDYLGQLQGVSFASSRQQGIVRDNRFYHAGLGITIAFPKDWVVLNQRNRLLAHTRTQDGILQITIDGRPENSYAARVSAEAARRTQSHRRPGAQLQRHGRLFADRALRLTARWRSTARSAMPRSIATSWSSSSRPPAARARTRFPHTTASSCRRSRRCVRSSPPSSRSPSPIASTW